MQQFFFSFSDIIATTCFGHTTIIKQHTVVYCLKLFVEVEVTLRLTVSQSVSQSVSQYVLVSSTLVGLAVRYYFL
jgi:hypothetical protein